MDDNTFILYILFQTYVWLFYLYVNEILMI